MSKNATQAFVKEAGISIKEHYDELISQVCKTVDARFSTLDERFKAQERALELQQQINDKNYEKQNEWRGAMNDREKTYITRQDHESLITLLNTKEDALIKDVKSLEITRATLDGKANQQQMNITFVFAVVAMIGTLLGLLCSLSGIILSIYLR